METVIVDTNVVSFFMRRDTRGEAYKQFLGSCVPAISFMTVAELRFGALLANWGETRMKEMEQTLHHYTLMPIDDATVWEFARVGVELRRQGRHQVNRADVWIAATARRHGVRLVTHNAKHFQSIEGIAVVTFSDA